MRLSRELILSGMQPTGARFETDIAAGRVVFEGSGAVPKTCTAVDAFFAIELRHSRRPRRQCLSGTHLDAHFAGAALAEIRVDEGNVIRKTGRGLDFAAEQQRVLMGDEQLAIVGDGRPAAAVHQRVVTTDAARTAVIDDGL